MLPHIYRKKFPSRSSIEVNEYQSQTVPGLAMSVIRLAERIMQGTAVVNEKQPVYEPYYDIDNPNPLRSPNVDLVDVQAHSNYLKTTYEQMKNNYQTMVAEAQKAQAETDPTVQPSA